MATNPTSDGFQLELVDSDGRHILQRAVDVEELLQQHPHSLPVGSGVTVRLEELSAANGDYDPSGTDSDGHYDEEEDEDEDEDSQDSSSQGSGGGGYAGDLLPSHMPVASAAPPPGTRQAGGWYEVIGELQRESVSGPNVKNRAGQDGYSAPGAAVGRGRGAPPDFSAATPMKLFPSASRPPRSTAVATAPQPVASANGANDRAPSRREVWAAFAPPSDPQTNYARLEHVSVMDGARPARRAQFRPSALSFHSMAAYLHAGDHGQRVLVYGGVAGASGRIQRELYEFSVLTGAWRRLEGRQFVPAGHMGHAMTVVEATDRLVVIGGVGPCSGPAGGRGIRPEAFKEDAVRALRARVLFSPELLSRSPAALRTLSPATRLGIGGSAVAASALPAADPPVGFVPLLFDMGLADQRWRAIQPAQPFPLAFHTVVACGSTLFVFGGLTEELVVSGQLIAVDAETYALRLVQPAGARRGQRSRRRHSNRGGGSDTDDEAAAEQEDTEAPEPGPRFLHTAVRFGNYMIIHGGFDAQNEARNDTWAFDMVNERWERLHCSGDAPLRAGHTACVVGCRMVVIGGFVGSLEEAGSPAGAEVPGGPATEQLVSALNLVPTTRGEHIWHADMKVRPALPPLVATASAPCGDHCSLVLFGGLTKRPAFKHGRGHHHHSDGGSHGDDVSDQGSTTQPLLRQLITLDDAVVITFPPKQRRQRAEDADAPHVNALGVAVDPNELPESFKTFVRRQEDFMKKKNAAVLATQKKTMLDEQEAMEPTIYFTEDEIECVLEKSEELCAVFTSYKVDSLPGNVPDRERRIHIVENCVSLSRQARDVVRSMKGSQVAVTAVKSKSHRRRAGQKFEDFSAAKPFRRVVIASLVDEINEELAVMHRLNKALRTVDWGEKDEFQTAVQDMQHTVDGFMRVTGAIMNKYVSRRVEKLMKGVDKHREVMRLLTEVVERNLEDKIWGRDEARQRKRDEVNAQRERADRAQAAATAASGGVGSGVTNARSASAAPRHHGARGTSRHRRLTGGGYHTDEATAHVNITEAEWTSLRKRAAKLEAVARMLETECREGMKSTTMNSATATAPPQATSFPVPARDLAPLVAPMDAASAAATTAPLTPNHADDSSLSDASSSASDAPAMPPPPAVAAPLPTPTVESTPAAPSEAPAPATASASPKEILIRRSDANREVVVDVAGRVAEVARAFAEALDREPEPLPTVTTAAAAGAKNDTCTIAGAITNAKASSREDSAYELRAAANVTPIAIEASAVPMVPVPPLVAGAAASGSPSSSSSSTMSSSSAASSAGAARRDVDLVRATASAASAVALAPPPPVLGSAPPATAAPTAPVDAGTADVTTAAASGYHVFYLRMLRPLLDAREELDHIRARISLIHLNEWDGDDLAGAPLDTLTARRYRRLRAVLTDLVQSITASFLAAAGAKKPRKRLQPRETAALKPPHRSRSAHRHAVKGLVNATCSSLPSSTTVPGTHRAVQAVTACVPAAADGGRSPSAATAAAAVIQAESSPTAAPAAAPASVPRLGRLPGTSSDPLAGFVLSAGAPPPPTALGGVTSAPLVPYECFLSRPAISTAAALSPPPPSINVQTSGRLVVEVSDGAPFSSVARQASPPPPSSSFAWAHPNTATTTVGNAVTAASINTGVQATVIAVAAGPTPLTFPSASFAAAAAAGGASNAVAGHAAATSIEQLRQLTAPRASSARQPSTIITPGPFVVNPEYMQTSQPAAAASVSAPTTVTTSASVAIATACAEEPDDYFYFSRTRCGTQGVSVTPPAPHAYSRTSPVPPAPPATPPSAFLWDHYGAGVTSSPPVGTVLGSQRLSAAIVRDSLQQQQQRRAPSSSSRTTGRPLAERTNALRTPVTSRVNGHADKKRLTPGELQILQGRQRMRRQ